MGQRVDQWLNRDEALYDNPNPKRDGGSQRRTRLRSQRVAAPVVADDGDAENEAW